MRLGKQLFFVVFDYLLDGKNVLLAWDIVIAQQHCPRVERDEL